MTIKTIDVTPTWETLLPLLLAMYERKDDNTHFILKQLLSMAQAADKWNAHVASTQTKEN